MTNDILAGAIRDLRERVDGLEGLDSPKFTLAAGGVLFASDTGKVNTDAANFYWDNTNKRLGIGTNNPGVALDVWSTTSAGLFTRVRSTLADSNNGYALANDARTYSIQVRGANNDAFHIIDENAAVTRLAIDTSGVTSLYGELSINGSLGALTINPRDGSTTPVVLYNPNSSALRWWTTGLGDVMALMLSNGYLRVGDAVAASYRLELPNTASSAGMARAHTFVTYSSKTRKQNIRAFNKASLRQRAKQLRVSEFDWIDEWIDVIDPISGESRRTLVQGGSNRADFGLIAEDVAAVFPELVAGNLADPATLGVKESKAGLIALQLVLDLIEELDQKGKP